MSAAVTTPGALLDDAGLDVGDLAVQTRDEPLEVEDDVGDVLADALDRRELVRDALDLDRGDRGALDGREQHAAQRVAVGVAEATIERLDRERPMRGRHVLVRDLRNLEIHQCRHSEILRTGGSADRSSGL